MKKNKIILSILITLLLQLRALATDLEFAQISDLHYQSNIMRKNINYYALPIIDSVADKINENKNIEFTLITGDAINKRKYDDAKFIYSHFNEIFEKPWYFVFGNHDTGGKPVFKWKLINLLKNLNIFFKKINKDYYVFKPRQDMIFIGINSNYSFLRTPIGHISKKQLNLIDSTIKNSNKNDVIVIFMHHTLIDFPKIHKNHYIKNADELKTILKKYSNPIMLLGGHYHASKIEQDGNIINVATPSLTSLPIGYRTIHIENNKDNTVFKFTYEEIDNTLLNYILSKINRKIIPNNTIKETDKNIIIKILK